VPGAIPEAVAPGVCTPTSVTPNSTWGMASSSLSLLVLVPRDCDGDGMAMRTATRRVDGVGMVDGVTSGISEVGRGVRGRARPVAVLVLGLVMDMGRGSRRRGREGRRMGRALNRRAIGERGVVVGVEPALLLDVTSVDGALT
jgi:hypothetical protein